MNPGQQAEWQRLELRCLRDPYAREVLRHCERILASRHCSRLQQRARRFFGYVVRKTLVGESDQIKESLIAVMVFDELAADFDATISSKVRVAASDLRRRLLAYARQEGRRDSVRITLPLNGYSPAIEDSRPLVVVTPFENWHPLGEHAHLCELATAELVHVLRWMELRVERESSLSSARGPNAYSVRGSVEPTDTAILFNLSIGDEAGHSLHSRREQGPRDDVLKVVRRLGEAIAGMLAAPSTPDGIPSHVASVASVAGTRELKSARKARARQGRE